MRTLLACSRAVLVLVVLAATAGEALAQGIDFTSRPIGEVRVEGNDAVSAQLILNQVQSKTGTPYNQETIAGDIQNITRLGRFSYVGVRPESQTDGSVNLVFEVREQTLLSDVQVVGNKAFGDKDLMGEVLLGAGDPIDPFLIDQAAEHIKRVYRSGGYFLVDVEADQTTLDENGILILRVREGPRVRIRGIFFEGNTSFTAKELTSKIKSDTYAFIFRKGVLSTEQLDQDVAELRDFYQQDGYLDVRVGRRVQLSDDQTEATLTFVIDEGRRYTVLSIGLEGNALYSDEQMLEAMELNIGDVYSQDRRTKSLETIEDLYAKLGYIDARVAIDRVFHPSEPKVDLTVRVVESLPTVVGNVIVRGNPLTQDKVIRRQIRGIQPGRTIDGTGIELTELRIRETGIIQSATLTVQGEPGDEVRDVLIEVEEGSTGSLSFGAAVSSDSGVFGAIDLTQKNFDIQDTPESVGEFFSGQAFRGAGQYFKLSLQPGDERSFYQVAFNEPYIFDSDYFMDSSLYLYDRLREDWQEDRVGGTVGFGKRFGDVWSAQLRTKLETVDVNDIEDSAPEDVHDVAGDNTITNFGFFISRSTVDSRVFPTEGTRLNVGIERTGTFGGDFDYTRFTSDFNVFFTVDEDFFGRKTVLSFGAELGYIFEDSEAPIFDRFYAGGRDFRGFEYRGVGPRGIREDTEELGDDPVGGDWLFLFDVEYNYPIYQDVLRGVFFMDTGTVQKDAGFDEYRMSVGAGIRLQLPIFGQVPFAFDLAVPVAEEEGDETRIFSFDMALPF